MANILTRKNFSHGGTCDWGEYDVVRDVKAGDLVELLVDGKFFKRSDNKPELYGGYVISVNKFSIILSPTHPNNICHGFSNRRFNYKQIDTTIETCFVREYRILNRE